MKTFLALCIAVFGAIGIGIWVEANAIQANSGSAPNASTQTSRNSKSNGFPLLKNAIAIGSVINIENGGKFAQVRVLCGRTSTNDGRTWSKPIIAKSLWRIDLTKLTFGWETDSADLAAGQVVAVDAARWIGNVRQYGWSGFLYLNDSPGWLTNGPGTDVCHGVTG